MSLSHDEAARLVAAAAAGDRTAWEQLVEAYGRLIWAIARNHRLTPGDSADVSQTTWLRLLEHIHRLNEPGRVGAWLATTARRECLRLRAKSTRTALVADETVFEWAQGRNEPAEELDRGLLAEERNASVRAAMAKLPPHCQQILRLLMLDPPPSYEEIAAAVGRPIGSLGPSRGRCLEKLRVLLADIEGVDQPAHVR